MMFAQRRRFADVDNLAINASSQVTAFEQVFEQIAKLTFLILHNGCENLIFRAGRLIQEAVNNLIGRLSLNRLAGNVTIPLTNPGVEHTQEVKNFCDRTDRTSRIPAGGFLLNRDRRSQP